MVGQWASDPTGRNQYRWFDGHHWTAHVANFGKVSDDPIEINSSMSLVETHSRTGSPSIPSQPHNKQEKPVGIIGTTVGVGASYAVLVYLGIPTGVMLFLFPPVGFILLGITIWASLRAFKRVSTATQRGVDALGQHLTPNPPSSPTPSEKQISPNSPTPASSQSAPTKFGNQIPPNTSTFEFKGQGHQPSTKKADDFTELIKRIEIWSPSASNWDISTLSTFKIFLLKWLKEVQADCPSKMDQAFMTTSEIDDYLKLRQIQSDALLKRWKSVVSSLTFEVDEELNSLVRRSLTCGLF